MLLCKMSSQALIHRSATAVVQVSSLAAILRSPATQGSCQCPYSVPQSMQQELLGSSVTPVALFQDSVPLSSLPDTGLVHVPETVPPPITRAEVNTLVPTAMPGTASAADKPLFLREEQESQTPEDDDYMSEDYIDGCGDDNNLVYPAIRFGKYDIQASFVRLLDSWVSFVIMNWLNCIS